MNVTILDLIEYVKKHLLLIALIMAAAVCIGIVYVDKYQTYTASTTIKYPNLNTETGYDTYGKRVDPYEMMSPSVIQKALEESGGSIEEVRTGISITPLINETTRKTQEALTDKGETFSYYPNEYSLTFTHNVKYGPNYGVQLLSRLLEAYDQYIQQTHTNTKQIPNIFSGIDYSQYDYMEICDLYEEQFNTINLMLQSMENEAPDFRSSKTGLTFNNLRYYFLSLQDVEYTKLYAYVREGCLSKNKELLLKNYHYKIDQLQLTADKKAEESRISYNILLDFYRQYKEGQGITDGSVGSGNNNADTNKIITDQEPSKLITTYDSILTGYVDSGVDSVKAQKDIEHYQSLIWAFENDAVPAEVKTMYEKKAQEIMQTLDSRMQNYIELSNETLSNYNVYKGAQYLSYLSSVSTKPSLSKSIVIAFAVMAGLALGILAAIAIEVFKRLKEEAALEAKRRKISMIESGKMPENLEKLPPFDRALFEAISNDFTEFVLFYQPIADTTGRYIGAEALVRWESAEFGMVMPNDFIAVAEKYDIMELLGKWITKEACTQCRKWNELYDQDFFVSVNFTLKQVTGQIFIDCICNAVDEVGIRADNLVLEVSGSSEIDDLAAAAKRLQTIKRFGVRVAIDGYTKDAANSGAAHLLPVDMLKIGRGHTKDILTNISDQNFVRSVVNQAQEKEIKVCAEGIETKENADMLTKLGVQYLQGYYYAKPAEAAKLRIEKRDD